MDCRELGSFGYQGNGLPKVQLPQTHTLFSRPWKVRRPASLLKNLLEPTCWGSDAVHIPKGAAVFNWEDCAKGSLSAVVRSWCLFNSEHREAAISRERKQLAASSSLRSGWWWCEKREREFTKSFQDQPLWQDHSCIKEGGKYTE